MSKRFGDFRTFHSWNLLKSIFNLFHLLLLTDDLDVHQTVFQPHHKKKVEIWGTFVSVLLHIQLPYESTPYCKTSITLCCCSCYSFCSVSVRERRSEKGNWTVPFFSETRHVTNFSKVHNRVSPASSSNCINVKQVDSSDTAQRTSRQSSAETLIHCCNTKPTNKLQDGRSSSRSVCGCAHAGCHRCDWG